jgi:hypothetical protein
MAFPTVEIRPKRSMALFAPLSIAMVMFSYKFVLALAAALRLPAIPGVDQQ